MDSSGVQYYKGKLFTGIAYYRYKAYSDQLIGEYNYKLGLLHGQLKLWHENGKLKGEYTYKEGNVNGEVKEWYENGALKRSGKIEMFEYKTINGTGQMWYEDGTLHKEAEWRDGELISEICFNKEGIEIDCFSKDDPKEEIIE